MRNSGSRKPLWSPAARLPGRAGAPAPPAGGRPFPTSDCGTCRSAPGRKWPNPGSGAAERGARSRLSVQRPKDRRGLGSDAGLARARERRQRRRRRGLWETRRKAGALRVSRASWERPCGAGPAEPSQRPSPIQKTLSGEYGENAPGYPGTGSHSRASAAGSRPVKIKSKNKPIPIEKGFRNEQTSLQPWPGVLKHFEHLTKKRKKKKSCSL